MQAGDSRPNTRSMSNARRQIRSYAELQEQLHHDLRAQHPEWVDSDGNSPVLDWYVYHDPRAWIKQIAVIGSVPNDIEMFERTGSNIAMVNSAAK
jgi:haloacid dehalogenase-like hydrolase